MSTFNNTKFIPTNLHDVKGVTSGVRKHFESAGYLVNLEDTASGSFISLTKGGIFKTVLGMKTSLNIAINVVGGGIVVEAKVGIFGQQLVPSLIMLFVAWPVLLTQIGGLVEQSKLDDQVITVIEQSVRALETVAYNNSPGGFCSECGGVLSAGARFCASCGAKQ